MLRRIVSQLREAHDSLRQTEQIYMVLVSVAIGLLGGLGAVGFRLLIQYLNRRQPLVLVLRRERSAAARRPDGFRAASMTIWFSDPRCSFFIEP